MSEIIRRYGIASEQCPDGPNYMLFYLAFRSDGSMCVLRRKTSERPQEEQDFEISPAEFDGYSVNGTSLRAIVVKALEQILPPSIVVLNSN